MQAAILAAGQLMLQGSMCLLEAAASTWLPSECLLPCLLHHVLLLSCFSQCPQQSAKRCEGSADMWRIHTHFYLQAGFCQSSDRRVTMCAFHPRRKEDVKWQVKNEKPNECNLYLSFEVVCRRHNYFAGEEWRMGGSRGWHMKGDFSSCCAMTCIEFQQSWFAGLVASKIHLV